MGRLRAEYFYILYWRYCKGLRAQHKRAVLVTAGCECTLTILPVFLLVNPFGGTKGGDRVVDQITKAEFLPGTEIANASIL